MMNLGAAPSHDPRLSSLPTPHSTPNPLYPPVLLQSPLLGWRSSSSPPAEGLKAPAHPSPKTSGPGPLGSAQWSFGDSQAGAWALGWDLLVCPPTEGAATGGFGEGSQTPPVGQSQTPWLVPREPVPSVLDPCPHGWTCHGLVCPPVCPSVCSRKCGQR